MTMSDDRPSDRAAFEAWARTKNLNLLPSDTFAAGARYGITYHPPSTEIAWLAWQAARASAQEPVAAVKYAECAGINSDPGCQRDDCWLNNKCMAMRGFAAPPAAPVQSNSPDQLLGNSERLEVAPPAAPVPVAAQEPDGYAQVFAQHDETARIWSGMRKDIPRRYTEFCAAPPAAPVVEREREIAEAKELVLDCTGSACLSGEWQSPATRQADLKAIRDKLLTVLGLLTCESPAAPVEPPTKREKRSMSLEQLDALAKSRTAAPVEPPKGLIAGEDGMSAKQRDTDIHDEPHGPVPLMPTGPATDPALLAAMKRAVEPPAPAAVEALRELVAVADSAGSADEEAWYTRNERAWAAARAALQSLTKEG